MPISFHLIFYSSFFWVSKQFRRKVRRHTALKWRNRMHANHFSISSPFFCFSFIHPNVGSGWCKRFVLIAKPQHKQISQLFLSIYMCSYMQRISSYWQQTFSYSTNKQMAKLSSDDDNARMRSHFPYAIGNIFHDISISRHETTEKHIYTSTHTCERLTQLPYLYGASKLISTQHFDFRPRKKF